MIPHSYKRHTNLTPYLTTTGPCLDLRSAWLEGLPGWSDLLQEHCAAQPPTGTPRPLLLQSLQQAGSFEGLLARVRTNPQLWCAGTGTWCVLCRITHAVAHDIHIFSTSPPSPRSGG